jgi:hypothetical protein
VEGSESGTRERERAAERCRQLGQLFITGQTGILYTAVDIQVRVASILTVPQLKHHHVDWMLYLLLCGQLLPIAREAS